MGQAFDRKFSEREIAAMRKLASDEDRLGARLFALLKRMAKAVPFAEDVLAAWFCARDPATPARVRIVLVMAVAYVVLPLDAIPDLLPFLGFSDDAAVVAAAIAAVATELKPAHRESARAALARL